MVFLLLLYISKDIFVFVQIIIKKKVIDTSLAHVDRFIAFGRCVRLTRVVVIVLMPYNLIRLGILFLSW